MRSLIAFSFLATVVLMSPLAVAQETKSPATTTQEPARTIDEDRDFDWGWLGLIGLLGLAGLAGRRRDRDVPRTTTTTR